MNEKIERLKAEYEELRLTANEAMNAARSAKERLNKELVGEKLREFVAMGGVIELTRVRVAGWDGRPLMHSGPFFVMGAHVGYDVPRFTLAKIKKDGTPSAAPAGYGPEHVVILPEDQPKGGDA